MRPRAPDKSIAHVFILDPAEARLSIQWDAVRLGVTPDRMVRLPRQGEPFVEASGMLNFNPPWKGLGISPYLLKDGEEFILAARVKEILTQRS